MIVCHLTAITKYRRYTIALVELKVVVVQYYHQPTAKKVWWGSALRVSSDISCRMQSGVGSATNQVFVR
jgi:hypothetical protein